jgi:hypothetical protein
MKVDIRTFLIKAEMDTVLGAGSPTKYVKKSTVNE